MRTKYSAIALLLFTTTAFAQQESSSVYSINFKMPSGNIICGGDIKKNPYDVAPWNGVSCLANIQNKPIKNKPKNCDHDWGGMFSLPQSGSVKMECYSDFPFDANARILKYGEEIKGNGWKCTSQKTGLFCMNNEKHGFKINKTQQELF